MIEMQNKLEKIKQINECERWLHGNDGRLNVTQLFVLGTKLIPSKISESAFKHGLKSPTIELSTTKSATPITLALFMRWSRFES